MLINKIRLALGGKKTVATSLVLIGVTAASSYGIDIDPELQKELTIIPASLIAIFLRYGGKSEAKGTKDEIKALRDQIEELTKKRKR